jgi:UDP-N-acetylglucosamine--N-acetylmuramyl-(pentapeptide) pyrophosphoryl-undecaprenol N-acetylglucosamine transferase
MRAFSRILLTGGGTAGHVNPALAIGRALGDERTAYLYVGVRGRAESDVVPREGIPIRYVRASAYPGSRPSVSWVPFLADLILGTTKALFLIRRFRPDVIVGTGGFASAPVMFAASLLRRAGLCAAKVYVHEQNAAPGRLNLLVGRLADRVFVSFPETLAAFPANGIVAGYPLRRRIQGIEREAARQSQDFAVPAGRTVVFAFGGSQGARTINQAIVDALESLLPHRDRLFIIHGTGLRASGTGYDPGRETADRLRARYTDDQRRQIESFYVSRPYFHEIERVYALADLVVVRAGAGTLNEIASLGLPAIVVPKANLPGEHQVMNARALARTGGAMVLYEETRCDERSGSAAEHLDGDVLGAAILGVIEPARLRQMAEAVRRFVKQDALEVIQLAVAGDPADAPPAGTQTAEALDAGTRLLSNAALVTTLEHALAVRRSEFRIAHELPSADDRAYYTSRAASLLVSPRWERRNLGVKLVGLLQAREKLPLVVDLLKDRRPAPWYKRALGGDFEQVGFIRRNALTAIARLGIVTPSVEEVLVAAVSDPYYEVRSEAARTAAALEASLDGPARRRLIAALVGLLHDSWLEVAATAAEALGIIGGHDDALPELVALQSHRYWIVRAAGLRGLLSLLERGRAGDLDQLERQLRGFVLTATDFRPEFTIRSAYASVVDAIARHRSSGT